MFRFLKRRRHSFDHVGRRELRRCGFEQMEPRLLLTAEMLVMGAVYIEQDVGSDMQGDLVQLSFVGGASGTELQRVVIGDAGGTASILFDTQAGGIGVDGWIEPQIVWMETRDPDASAELLAEDGSGQLIVELNRFHAGDRLAILVDVDEVEVPDESQSVVGINDGLDPIASGVEFQGVPLVASFSADHYQSTDLAGEFRNAYDVLLLDSGLDLPADNEGGLRDRTAGVVTTGSQRGIPVTLAGSVYLDKDADLERDPEDAGIANVAIELWRQLGDMDLPTGQLAWTDSDGYYHFDEELDLPTGVYQLRQQQPDGLLSLAGIPGQVSGRQVGAVLDGNPNILAEIELNEGGLAAQDYDFVETMPAVIRGRVELLGDVEGSGAVQPMSDVRLLLFDAAGQAIAETLTSDAGEYRFDDLWPGVYAVAEVVPAGVFAGKAQVGFVADIEMGYEDSATLLSGIELVGGDQGSNYDFVNLAPVTLSGYVFQDGQRIVLDETQVSADIRLASDGLRTPDDQAIPGVVIELLAGSSGAAVLGQDLLPAYFADGPVVVTSATDGFYQFAGLPPGRYMLQETQPAGWIDGHDSVGTAGGTQRENSQSVSSTFIAGADSDRISEIDLKPGQDAREYNFSELKVQTIPAPLPFEPPQTIPAATPIDLTSLKLPPAFVVSLIPPSRPQTDTGWSLRMQGSSSGQLALSWHLSVINAGAPRWQAAIAGQPGLMPVAAVDPWGGMTVADGTWQLGKLEPGRGAVDVVARMLEMGLVGAVPVAGDFNGDGVAEIGIYHAGTWYLDMNGNGRWDDDDLWAELGEQSDMPVVGDWDGDGKDDIGVLGRRQPGDLAASAVDPGLPDPDNETLEQPKNIPPAMDEASSTRRVMQSSREGTVRLDVVDHVFEYGGRGDVPVAGDWNGDGVDTVGVFRDGQWLMDSDGDGHLTEQDRTIEFGQPGDIPLVGDWDGDGVDQVGLYRQGRWILDSNQDGRLDNVDRVFEMGNCADRPVVGDWDGDGMDDPAIYQPNESVADPSNDPDA